MPITINNVPDWYSSSYPGDSTQTLYLFSSTGDSSQSSIDFVGDSDIFQFDTFSGVEYSLTVFDLSESTTFTPYVEYYYGSTLVDTDIHSVSSGSTSTVGDISSSGSATFYVVVSDLGNDSTGAYQITLSGSDGSSITASSSVSAGVGFYGESGSDTLIGSGYGDTLFGASGSDVLSGGSGADLMYGNKQTDLMRGGSGDDTLFGGQNSGANSVGTHGAGPSVPRSGVDTLSGGSGDDLLYGNFGFDLISGGSGDDVLYGGQDDDTMVGGYGNDLLFGNLGADTFYGGTASFDSGQDTIIGGDGDDIAYYFSTRAAYQISITSDFGLAIGNDVLYGVETIGFADQTVSVFDLF